MRHAAIRIVFNVRHSTTNTVFVPLEIDHAIQTLMTTTTMQCSDLALIVTTALFLARIVNSFSGRFFLSVISAKSLTEAPRRPGVTGL